MKTFLNCSKISTKIILASFSIICFIILVEFFLRGLGYLRSRKEDLEWLGDQSAFNIICLGDSFTYGWGVETPYVYPRQLEKMLNNGGLGRRFRVFNLAVPGSNSSQHLKYLEEILGRYEKPDLIILLTGANDHWNLADSNIYRFINKEAGKSILNMRFRMFISKLRVYKMLKIISLNLRRKAPESAMDQFKQIPRYKSIDEKILKRLLEYNLTQTAILAKSNDIKLILHNYPRGNLYADNIPQRVALRFNLPFVDNFSLFNERLAQSDFKDLFLYDNSHPNRTGCKIMAEGLYKAICNDIFR